MESFWLNAISTLWENNRYFLTSKLTALVLINCSLTKYFDVSENIIRKNNIVIDEITITFSFKILIILMGFIFPKNKSNQIIIHCKKIDVKYLLVY